MMDGNSRTQLFHWSSPENSVELLLRGVTVMRHFSVQFYAVMEFCHNGEGLQPLTSPNLTPTLAEK